MALRGPRNGSSISSKTNINRKRKAEENSMNIASKKARFYSLYHRQQWSLPDSIIYYISKNPSSSKCYQKMVQSCKYFFIKNPILIVKQICFGFEKWPVTVFGKTADLKSITSKIWVTDRLETQEYRRTPPNKLSTIILPKLYRSDITVLYLFSQNITFNEFLFLSSNLEDLILRNSTVKNDDGTFVLCENLVKVLPKAIEILFNCNEPTIFTSNTVKELLELPHFSKINRISFTRAPEIFDFETLFSYIKKNKHSAFHLHFDGTISEAFKNRLKSVIEEVIATEGREYRAPVIKFPSLPESKYEHLRKLSKDYNKFS